MDDELSFDGLPPKPEEFTEVEGGMVAAYEDGYVYCIFNIGESDELVIRVDGHSATHLSHLLLVAGQAIIRHQARFN